MENLSGYSVDTRELLGRGGFGEVFLGYGPEGRVAAKRVWLKTTALQDILAEVQTLKNIKPHQNILKFIYSERSKDFLWIFTEYCEQGDLSQYCTTHELEFSHKVHIAHQCACAVAHLHKLNPPMAHRDIKPNNILVTHDANDRLDIRLADFGLAKTAAARGATLAMRTFCGTEAYMAPEHFFLERRVCVTYGRSVDIFALGLVFAGLLDAIPGKPLLPIQVRGSPIGYIMWKMQEQSMPVWSPVTLCFDDHPLILELKAVISAMLSFGPEDRPTADDMEHKLKCIYDSSPPISHLPVNLEDKENGTVAMEEIFYKELTSNQPTVVKKEKAPGKRREPTLFRKGAVNKRREFRSTAHMNLRATMDFGSAMLKKRGPDYKVVVVGGTTGYNVSDVCWQLDTPDDGFFWKCFAEVPHGMRQQYGYSVVAVNEDTFVMAGGSSSSSCQALCFRYRISRGVWEKLPTAHTARCSAGLVMLNNVLYFFGGEGNRQTILKSCEKLNLDTGAARQRWERCMDMPVPMVFPLAAATGQEVYVVTNTHRDNKIRQRSSIALQCYNPKANSWKFKAPLPASVKDTSGSAAVGDGPYLFLVGGWDRLCARYDTHADSWTLLKKCQYVHAFAAVCCAGSKINILGGKDESGPTNHIEEYDIKENQWRTRVLEMPESIIHHHAMVLKI